ncbi:GGDEF domain-containing protein, partial [Klebsiella pneumoniae]
AVGDVVLGEVARCCQQHSRRGDVIARYGGEEFILLMPHCDLASATAQAERLRVAIESTVMQAGDAGGLKVTASFGVAECLLE